MRRDLTAAMKNRDRVATAALRSALAAIENAEAQPASHPDLSVGSGQIAGAAIGVGAAEVERRNLSDADVRVIVAREISERAAEANRYDELGRADAAARLRAEADVLTEYVNPNHE